MTPQQFIAKWRGAELKERSGSHSHFIDLCTLLGVLDPASADQTGENFAFEKGASKTGGGEGWADVWKRGCFAWEYKGRHANLDKALAQLLQYAASLENPPLLIVSDMDTIRVHTNWTNTVQQVHIFPLEDLLDAARRDQLKCVFTNPEAFRPSKTRQELTEDTAGEFADLAQRLRDRGHEAQVVAHFVNRLAFCMFAEDVELLPEKLFTRLLERAQSKPERFKDYADKLFTAMKQGGELDFLDIPWFNGGLFDAAEALPLTGADIEDLYRAAKRDWSQIDPSILGTLFERGLDPSKRSQLGAHYTDREKIMLIVQPTIIDPLEAEWADARTEIQSLIEGATRRVQESIEAASTHSELSEEVKALRTVLLDKAQMELFADLEEQKRVRGLDSIRATMRAASRQLIEARLKARTIHSAFVERLARFRVLDPACGSGNFLYVALRALKDIEHRANLDAESLGLSRGFPRTGPENVLGIELNPYAAELARVSVWIGEIQWMRSNGFEAGRNPILRSLETIECRDAVLLTDEHGKPVLDPQGKPQQAVWPVADVVIGNPPFLGNKKMIGELGEDYTRALRKAWRRVPGGADLVCYWFAAAWDRIVAGKLKRAGLVSTNSIRGGANREVLKSIVEHGRIFNAWSDEGWTVDGAAVRVSLVSFDGLHGGRSELNGQLVLQVASDLANHRSGTDLTQAKRLTTNESLSFMGVTKSGPFDISGSDARRLLCQRGNPNGRPNSDVVKRSVNGVEVVRRITDRWILDFGPSTSVESASLYEGPFEFARQHIFSERQKSKTLKNRELWWRYERSRPEMYAALKPLERYIGTAMVAKHRIFVWLHKQILPENLVIVIAREDDTTFGILHSRFHELWALRMGTSLEDRPRYTPSTTFETYPFPAGLSPDLPASSYAKDPSAQAIAAAAGRLSELRENWLNPPDLVLREPEVVPGYPSRILPKDEAAARELATRTLTNLYNARPAWLDHAHRALDEAVADAYGWGDDFRAGSLTDDEILARLFALNQARASGG